MLTLQDIEGLVPLLQFLAGAGAGIVASWLFNLVRERNAPGTPFGDVLHTPLWARLIVLFTTYIIGALAAVALAFVLGESVPQAVNVAISGFISLVIAQLRHAIESLPREVTPAAAKARYAHPEAVYVPEKPKE